MKQQIPWGKGAAIGRKVVKALEPFCQKVEVAGSIRRGKKTVGDVDIVVVPLQEEKDNLLAVFRGLGQCDGKGSVMLSGQVDGVQVDMWLVPFVSWGAALQFATGSAEENIRLRALAKSRGWRLNRYALTDASGNVLAGQTEEGIYEALGLPYPQPKDRS